MGGEGSFALEIQAGGGCSSSGNLGGRGGYGFFSGITHWSSPLIFAAKMILVSLPFPDSLKLYLGGGSRVSSICLPHSQSMAHSEGGKGGTTHTSRLIFLLNHVSLRIFSPITHHVKKEAITSPILPS